MATIAQLATIFTVDNSQFKSGLRDSEKRARNSSRSIVGHTKNMARSFRGTINSVFNLRTAVATLAGSAGIGLLVKNELDAIDKSAKFARMIGVSTKELTGLQHAAEISSGMIDTQFNMAIQRMSRRVAEAAKGTGDAKAAIKELGLDAQALAKSGPAEAFKQISQAIQSVEDPTQRLRIGFKLFDSEGAQLVNTLNLGREGIEKLQAEADKLGITFSEFDASQVEMANDAINRMQKSFKGVTTQLAIGLAPVITGVSDEITEAQKNSNALFSSIQKGGKFALSVIKAFSDGVRTIQIALKGAEVIGNALWSVVLNLSSAFLHFIADIVDLPNKLNPLIEKLNQIPGVNVPLFGSVDRSGFISDVTKMADASVGAIRKSKDELHQMMMEPLPSQSIDNFIKNVQERTAQARAAASSGASGTGAVGGGAGGVAPVDEQEKKTRERKLEFIRNSMMTEMELERQQHEKKLEFIQETDESMFEYEGEKRRLIESMEAQHQERMNDISARGQSQMLKRNIQFMKQMERGMEASGAAQVNIMTGAVQQITAATATENKKMFKLNKTAAIANAVISTYQGVAMALGSYPPPLSFVMAALQLAAGLAQVKAIKSRSFQGGGSGGAAGGGVAPSVGPTPAPPVTPVNGQGETTGSQAPERSVNIVVNGPVDRTYLLGALIPALSEEINENDVTFINSESAQSRELSRANR